MIYRLFFTVMVFVSLKLNAQSTVHSTQGEKGTDAYDMIYDTITENRKIVQTKTRFAYINAQTGKLCSEFYPLYYQKAQKGIGEKGRKFMAGFASSFVAPFSVTAENKMNNYFSPKAYVDVANPPQVFHKGYAIIGVGDNNQAKLHGDSLFINPEFVVKYVFIDTLGKEMSPRYEEANPFTGQWTWVKTAKGYQRINRQFKPLVAMEYFEDVRPVWNGDYFIVEKEVFKTGLMNSKGEWIAKPIYSMITEKENQLIGITNTVDKVLVKK